MMHSRFFLAVSLIYAFVLAACPAPPPPGPPPGPAYGPPPPAAGQPAPAQPGSETVPAQPGSETVPAQPGSETVPAHPVGKPPASALAADGARCSQGSDCQSGICEGQGCGPDAGVCTPKARVCTRDYRAYCGCDGVTFHGSGSCPGRLYAHKGECQSAAKRADGSPCATADQCLSGVCEGEGCGADETGTCAPAKRACTRDLRTYCGCDGQTFRGSGSCPGQRYQHRGACDSTR